MSLFASLINNHITYTDTTAPEPVVEAPKEFSRDQQAICAAKFRAVMQGKGDMSSSEIGDALGRTRTSINATMASTLIPGKYAEARGIRRVGTEPARKYYRWVEKQH